jgi:A/G-specific adenine glycosylase
MIQVAEHAAVRNWHEAHRREFPWRDTMDPYRLAITELMLVRTRADQVAAIWSAFFADYPDIKSLAEGSPTRIEGKLEALGLRWRARLIRRFAVAAQASGDWQATIAVLPGVGPYVAAAVAIGVDGVGTLPVDVTIARLLARYFGIRARKEPRRDPQILSAAASVGPVDRQFFHAVLDLAAMVCKPRLPVCGGCPLRDTCAYDAGREVAKSAGHQLRSSSAARPA